LNTTSDQILCVSRVSAAILPDHVPCGAIPNGDERNGLFIK